MTEPNLNAVYAVAGPVERYCVESGRPVSMIPGDRCLSHGAASTMCTTDVRPAQCKHPHLSPNHPQPHCSECGRDLPDWDPRVGWDEAEEGRPAPDCAQGLWLAASRWRPEHGAPDAHSCLTPPPGTRCVGCGQELPPYLALVWPVGSSDGSHYHCDACACYLEDDGADDA